MKILNNKYFKIIVVFGIIYLISIFSIKNIFIAQSPKFNPFFAQNLMAKASSLWTKTTNFIAFKNIFLANNNSSNNYPTKTSRASPIVAFNLNTAPKNVIDDLSVPLNKVSQGVYAGEKNGIKVQEVRTGELEYLEYTFNIKGKEIKIKIPKDQQPPSQEVVEALYK